MTKPEQIIVGVDSKGSRESGVDSRGGMGSEFVTGGILTLATLTGVGQLAATC